MTKLIQALVLAAFLTNAGNAVATDTIFPLPRAAYDVRHVVIENTGTRQDYYKVKLAYPSMEVVAHYRALFAGWSECSNKHGWESFGDPANNKKEYIHQLVYEWVPPSNDKVVTLGLRYVSPGIETRQTPSSNEQLVFVLLNEPLPNAKAEMEQEGLVCTPNPSFKRDALKRAP